MKVALCNIEEIERASRLKQASKLGAWSVQFGDQVLLYAAKSKWAKVTARAEGSDLHLEQYPGDVRKSDMYLVVQKGRLFQQEYPNVQVMLDKGRYLAVELTQKEFNKIGSREDPCFIVQPLVENSVVFDVRTPPTRRSTPEPWIQNLLNNIARTNYETTLTHLVSFPTRHSTSSHYADAAEWCRDQLVTMGYNANLETISIGSNNSFNVVADKPGTGSGTRDLVLVVAHLDSVNSAGGPNASAPGADDNGSGSAAIIEIARVLKNHASVHDLRFILFGGEEQGLFGSKQYVSSLSAAERNRIRAVVNMDMIGTLNTSVTTVLIEGNIGSQPVIDDLEDAANTYTSLGVQTSLNPFASDHLSFINAGLPAVLTIEGADSANSNIHTANDTLAHISYDLAVEILKMNVALAAAKLGIKEALPKKWHKDPPQDLPNTSPYEPHSQEGSQSQVAGPTAGQGVPFVLATPGGAAGEYQNTAGYQDIAGQQVSAAYQQLLAHYAELYARGLLDASGYAAWQAAAAAFYSS